MLRTFCGAGCARGPGGALLDTSRRYHHVALHGDTEATLGEVFVMSPSLQKRLSFSTKADPAVPPHFSLSRQSVIEQCNTSLEKLEIDSVDLFYLSSPDPNTDVEDTLAGVQQLHNEGKIKELDLAGFPAEMVDDIWQRCKQRGMLLPTVYQGTYNVTSRELEQEILPKVRELGLRLHICGPLAGGLLTGRYAKLEDLVGATEGRFSAQFDDALGNTVKAGTELYRSMYAQPAIFDGVDVLCKACSPELPHDANHEAEATLIEERESTEGGIRVRVEVREVAPRQAAAVIGEDMGQVALRWLLHHSCLAAGDGIVIGVSRQSHLVTNLSAWSAGPLPEHLARACEAAWEAVQAGHKNS